MLICINGNLYMDVGEVRNKVYYYDPNNDWRVVSIRTPARHTTGQCAICGATTHVTVRCRHREKVECRERGKPGRNEKLHKCEDDSGNY